MRQARPGVVLLSACWSGARLAQVAMEFPAMARAAFLLPGLVNGYSRIAKRLGAIEGRLTRIERVLSEAEPSTGSGGIDSSGYTRRMGEISR